ncbi:SH3 domain-containing protein [Gracilibacillus sp. Marseille-QA3620]
MIRGEDEKMNKRLLKSICLIVILSFVLSQVPASTEAASYSAKVTADILNVRSKATTKSSITFKLKQGSTVTVTSEKNGWSFISYNKKTGWVSSQYLSYTNWTGYSTGSIDIRQSASSKAKSLSKINKGTALTVKDQSGNWLKVYYSSKKITGWVLASQISTKKPSTSTSVSNLGTYYVTATSLNVREKATTSSKVIGSVKKNAALTLLKKSGSWGQVKLSNGKTGWVSMSYLTTKKPSTVSSNLGTYYVTASTLYVREKATTSSRSVASVKKNTAVTLLKKNGSWGQIKLSNGKTGWVSMSYLTTKKPSTAASNLGTYYVTASSLNVREKATTSSKVIGSVKRYAALTLLKKSGSWGQVKLSNGKTGWVSMSYLTTKKPSTAASNLGTYYVTASSLNVREKATTSSKVIGSVKRYAALTLLKKSGSWGQVKLSNGKTGWVSMKYLTTKKPSTPASNLGTYYVTVSSLNVREKATTSSKVIGSVKKNAALTLLKKSGTWGQVKLSNGKTGWVSMKYLTTKKPSTPASNLGTYYVTVSSLNVREKATTSSKVIGSVKKNASLTLLKKSGSWGQVKLSNGKKGWVSTKYLTTKKPESNLGTYYVSPKTLAIKEKASSSAKTLVTLKQNETVTLQSKSGDWGKVKTSTGKVGWTQLKHLSTKKIVNTPTPGPVAAPAEYMYLTGKASVYKDANAKSTVLTTAALGTKVQKLSTKNGFTQVKLTSGIIGWVSSSLLKTKTVKGKTIVIDAGHGGTDPGAVGSVLRTKEKNITLSTANQLAALLRNAGATVIMTRSSDVYITLDNRAAISNRNKADAFISIHYNAASTSNAKGIETYYYLNSRLASSLQGEMVKTTGLLNRGVKYAKYRVLSINTQPAALVELGFLTNAAEEKKISQASYHKKAAQGILNGLNVFFSK